MSVMLEKVVPMREKELVKFGLSDCLSSKCLICKFLTKLYSNLFVFLGCLVICVVKNNEYLISKE
jgi:hypothetical protein